MDTPATASARLPYARMGVVIAHSKHKPSPPSIRLIEASDSYALAYVAFIDAISPRNSPINSAMARLEVSLSVVTPVTNNSTFPDKGSSTLIISDPSGLTVQTQDKGRKLLSMMWRSSRMEIMTIVPKSGFRGPPINSSQSAAGQHCVARRVEKNSYFLTTILKSPHADP